MKCGAEINLEAPCRIVDGPFPLREVAGEPQHVAGTKSVVYFSDQSAVTVDVAGMVRSEDKTKECIVAAANKYSTTCPDGVLSKVLVDLFGTKITTSPG